MATGVKAVVTELLVQVKKANGNFFANSKSLA
jgi:hypothetical protein